MIELGSIILGFFVLIWGTVKIYRVKYPEMMHYKVRYIVDGLSESTMIKIPYQSENVYSLIRDSLMKTVGKSKPFKVVEFVAVYKDIY